MFKDENMAIQGNGHLGHRFGVDLLYGILSHDSLCIVAMYVIEHRGPIVCKSIIITIKWIARLANYQNDDRIYHGDDLRPVVFLPRVAPLHALNNVENTTIFKCKQTSLNRFGSCWYDFLAMHVYCELLNVGPPLLDEYILYRGPVKRLEIGNVSYREVEQNVHQLWNIDIGQQL